MKKYRVFTIYDEAGVASHQTVWWYEKFLDRICAHTTRAELDEISSDMRDMCAGDTLEFDRAYFKCYEKWIAIKK